VIHRLCLLLLVLAVSACAVPQAHYIHVNKSKREMALLDEKRQPIKIYKVALGFDPIGHKIQEGDGRTPEGLYKISSHNPRSRFHKSLRISYPNRTDYFEAQRQGYKPGGDIVIHGVGDAQRVRYLKDWTLGCIAVKDHEIDQIYSMVPNGIPILIEP